VTPLAKADLVFEGMNRVKHITDNKKLTVEMKGTMHRILQRLTNGSFISTGKLRSKRLQTETLTVEKYFALWILLPCMKK